MVETVACLMNSVADSDSNDLEKQASQLTAKVISATVVIEKYRKTKEGDLISVFSLVPLIDIMRFAIRFRNYGPVSPSYDPTAHSLSATFSVNLIRVTNQD
jgi:hypothetical protein